MGTIFSEARYEARKIQLEKKFSTYLTARTRGRNYAHKRMKKFARGIGRLAQDALHIKQNCLFVKSIFFHENEQVLDINIIFMDAKYRICITQIDRATYAATYVGLIGPENLLCAIKRATLFFLTRNAEE